MTLSELSLELPSLIDEAKSIWGEEEVCSEVGGKPGDMATGDYCDCFVYGEWGSCNTQPKFMYQIQTMLESRDPELYLRENT